MPPWAGFVRYWYAAGSADVYVLRLQYPRALWSGEHPLAGELSVQKPAFGTPPTMHFSVAKAQPCLRPQKSGSATE